MSKTQKKSAGKYRTYYRYQQDKQKVIRRTDEQKRIVNEYFIVKNKPKYNLILIILGVVALLVGIILLGCGMGANRLSIGRGDSGYPDLSDFGYDLDYGSEQKNPTKATNSTALIVAGVILALGGGVCLIIMKKTVKYLPAKVMTDEEYEALVDKRIEGMDIKQMGLDQLGIDADEIKDVTPLVFQDNAFTPESLHVFNPQTNKVHSSTKSVTYVYFTDKQLLTYTVTFDMCCNAQTEESNELFYHDVCDVASKISKNVMDTGSEKFEYCSITFSVISTNASISVSMGGDNERLNSVQAMKQKIRERKA